MIELIKYLIRIIIETSSPVLRDLLIDWLLSLFHKSNEIVKQESAKSNS